MQIVLAFVIGGLFSAGIYMMLRRTLLKLLIGLGLLSHAINLLIFSAAHLTRANPPVIALNQAGPQPNSDPLPQALILTAIVISFGVIAFAVGLAHRSHKLSSTDDLNGVSETEKS